MKFARRFTPIWFNPRWSDILAALFVLAIFGGLLFAETRWVKFNSGFGSDWDCASPGSGDPVCVKKAARPHYCLTQPVAGPGVQPYLQFPWSVELGGGWAITGMETNFFMPSSPTIKFANQSTFVIEKEVTKRSFLFVEYVGDYPFGGASSQLFNSGGGYRVTNTQQIDFHIGVGLNRNAPAYIFGIGYSFRVNGLLRLSPSERGR
jgi:hypothetical protein